MKAIKDLKICIVGCGRIAPMHFGPAAELADLVGCCDIIKERAQSFADEYGCNAYTDYKRMLEVEKPDILHICLPHHLHVPVAEYAINAGVAVLSEKPMAIDYGSAERAVLLAEKKGVQYGVIFQCRYNDASVAVKRALDSGRLGKIISCVSMLTWSRAKEYYADSDWKGTLDKEGGGVVIDQAIHSVDLVNWLVGSEHESVSCTLSNRDHPYLEVEDTAEGLVKYKNGVRYAFYCMNNYGCDDPIEIRLYCERGNVRFDYERASIVYADGTTENVEASFDDTGCPSYWGNSHGRQIEQFYRAFLGECPLEISAREALKTHRLVFDIYGRGKK